jgi:putative membrane protein
MKMTLNKLVLTSGISMLAIVALADDGSWRNNNMDSTNAPTNMPVTAQHFVWEAGTANLKEVRLSELALDKSQNDDVTSFARHMIRDHTAANKKLMKIAEKEGLNFPDTNIFSSDANWNSNSNNWNSANGMNGLSDTNSSQTTSSAGIGRQNYKGAELLELANETESVSNDFQTVQSIQALSGPQFDQAYVEKMVRDHVKAINKFQNAAVNLEDPSLKKYAEKTLPTLREHYRMVLNLRDKLNGTQNGNADGMTHTSSTMPPTAVPQ